MGWFDWKKAEFDDPVEREDAKGLGWLWGKYKAHKARKDAERKRAEEDEQDTEKAIREALDGDREGE